MSHLNSTAIDSVKTWEFQLLNGISQPYSIAIEHFRLISSPLKKKRPTLISFPTTNQATKAHKREKSKIAQKKSLKNSINNEICRTPSIFKGKKNASRLNHTWSHTWCQKAHTHTFTLRSTIYTLNRWNKLKEISCAVENESMSLP